MEIKQHHTTKIIMAGKLLELMMDPGVFWPAWSACTLRLTLVEGHHTVRDVIRTAQDVP